jgi:hypothetical protein
MKTARLPGFEQTLSVMTGDTRSRGSGLRRHNEAGADAISMQARIGPVVGVGGRAGFGWPSWCELSCAAAAATCIAGTAGTGTAACILAEIVCLEACNHSLAFA